MADDDFAQGQASAASSSSSSSDQDEETEFQSMTAKGVQHLCSELLELKQESDHDFQKIVFSNYAAFLAILREMNCLQSEVLRLKHQASSQRRIIKEIYDRISSRVLPEDAIGSMNQEIILNQPSSPGILETHTESVSEILDLLLSEYRLDDAIALLEMEAEFVQNLQLAEKISTDQLTSYNSTISEKKAMLADNLICVAKHPRVSAPELQKALLGLCQLGDIRLATELMLQYYDSRIASEISNLQSLKELPGLLFIQQVAKLVCSMISQAVGSFVAFHGETYPYALELTQWASKEIETLAACLCKYIESLSETSGRLSTAVEGMQIAVSYCSLLKKKRIFLQPCLIEHICPCIEGALQLHIDHLSRVISIFTSTDTWTLGKYRALGILTGRSRAITNQQPEYLFLSNSGRKFATLLQSVVEDISPLITLEMERSVLQGIIGLFKSYVVILEHAFTGDTDEGHLRINLSESPVQGVSVLANLSTLVQFFSCIVRNLFDGIHHLGNEIENHIMLIRDMYSSLKLHFLDQFISNIFSPDADHESGSEICISSRQGDPRIYDMIPSVPYLELYLELKKLQKLGEDDSIDSNWLISLLGEVTDATFNWMLNKSEIWRINKESLPDHQVEFTQFILDAHFLAEVARSGGYLSDNAVNIFMDIVPHVEATFVSAGLNPPRDVDNKEWLANAAIKALHKLQELHQRETLENENASTEIRESYRLYAPQFGSDTLFGDDKESTVNALESGVDTNTMGSGIIVSPVKENNQEENYRKADERQLESGVDANTMGSGIIVSPVKENNQEEN